jgi:hypothetical protein
LFTLHNALQVQATPLARQAAGLALSVISIAIFIGQSMGAAAAAVARSRMGSVVVFVATAAGFLAFGLCMTALLRRHA